MKSSELLKLPIIDAATTSYPSPIKQNSLTDEEKMEIIEENFKQILETLGLNLGDDSIGETPARMAKMYVKEVFSGLKIDNYPSLNFVDTPKSNSNVILIKDTTLNSICEHHLVPMTGVAHIAYIPNGKLIGLSKINRIAKYFCRRPQLQERLSVQIADSLSSVLNTKDVAIFTQLKHFCVSFRGVADPTSTTQTQVLKGRFEKDPIRTEFLSSFTH